MSADYRIALADSEAAMTDERRHEQARAVKAVPLDDPDANEAMRTIRIAELERIRAEYLNVRDAYRLALKNFGESLSQPRTWQPKVKPVKIKGYSPDGSGPFTMVDGVFTQWVFR